MLIAFLAAVIVFLLGLCAFLAFDNAMFKQERQFLLRRTERAEWESAAAVADKTAAERDALSAHVEAEEAQQKVTRLSSHVAALLRQSAHDAHVSFQPRATYHIERATPTLVAAAQCPEAN